MNREVIFGLGGFCENCDETHDHPLHNIVEVIETPDVETPEELGLS
jgi:hypothetical protein